MRLRTCVVLGLLVILPGGATLADEPAPFKGSLVIVGGGGMPDSVRKAFVDLAGGNAAKIVVVPTASSSADDPKEHDSYLAPWRPWKPASLKLVHTRSREKANDAAFCDAIKQATAVWFSGGDQSRIMDAYAGTMFERELRALLDRGGVIGGTSAGAAIMTEVMITGGATKAETGKGFGFLKGAVVDQHFLRRSRINRLVGVLADHRELIGIGIDEGTAFIRQGDSWSVKGDSFVLAISVGPDGKPSRIESYREGASGTFATKGWPLNLKPRR